MSKLLKSLAGLVVALGLAGSAASAAPMQQGVPVPQIAVPTPAPIPQPVPVPAGSFYGCYQVAQDLYGPYTMNFCLRRIGSRYTVDGANGTRCSARIDWSAASGQAVIDLRATNCTNGLSWTADQMACAFTAYNQTGFTAPADGGARLIEVQYNGPPQLPGTPNGPPLGSGAAPRIAVPTPGAPPAPVNVMALRCIYQPGAAGYPPLSIVATRTSN